MSRVARSLFFLVGAGFIQNAAGQQNLFNVPSSDITIEGKPFFQQQINIEHSSMLFNTTFCMGIGRDMEVGFNVLGVDVNTKGGGPFFNTNSDVSNPPVYPFYTLNFQKAFPLNDVFKLAAGTQAGYSAGFHFGHYEYLNLVTILTRTRSKIITGAYYGSQVFMGPDDRNPLLTSGSDPVGVQLGWEQEIIREKLLFMVEHISGNSSFGVTCLGGAYFLSEHWVLSAGYQLSNAGGTNANSLILEVTFVPSAAVHKHIFRRGHRMKVYE